MSTPVLRPLCPGDHEAVKQMMSAAWSFAENISPRALKAYLDFYFTLYMRRQNYAMVAELDGEVVGFVVGRNDLQPMAPGLRHWLTFAGSVAQLLFSAEGRRRLRIAAAIHRCNRALMRGWTRGADGELLLFVVREGLQGQGIGSRLLERFFADLRVDGAQSFYLYTDELCSIDYYRRRRYRQIAQRSLHVDVQPVFQSTFYLYAKDL